MNNYSGTLTLYVGDPLGKDILTRKLSQTASHLQIVPQMNPGPEMIPRLFKNIFQDHW